jgi:hypothetical protein
LGKLQGAFHVHLPDERVIAKGGDGSAVEDVSHLLQARIVKKPLWIDQITEEDIPRVSAASFSSAMLNLRMFSFTRLRAASAFSARTKSSRLILFLIQDIL